MDFQNLENNSIIVVPNQLKEKVLLKLNESKKLTNIKLMGLDDFKKKYYFDYTTETIYFLMQKYCFSYDFCLDIINNLYYINSKNYGNQKLDFLAKIKKELINNNLLIIDPFFKINVTKRKIYVYGFDWIDNFFNNMLKDLSFEIVPFNQNNYNHDVYEFENIDDEVNFLAYQICQLIKNDIDINKIKIINPSSEYLTIIKRTFTIFKIPFNLNTDYLISTKMVANFLKFLNENVEETLNNLKAALDSNDELALIEYNQIVQICNKYNWCDNFKQIENLLIEEFKRTKIAYENLEQKIEFVPLENNIFNDDEFIFIVGFNQNNYPLVYKDDEYLDDTLKKLLKLEITSEKNMISYRCLIEKINKIRNLSISYKLKTPFNVYYKSEVIDNQKLKIIKNPKQNCHYSKLNDQLILAKYIDEYLKYGVENPNLPVLYNTFSNLPYKKYNNQYTIIKEEAFKNYQKGKLSLSYSTIDNFYRCGFRYYSENILKMNAFDNDFTLFIGKLFHYILSIMYNDDFNFETSFNQYINDNYQVSSYKEEFFIQKLKKELNFIINTIKEQEQYTSLTNYLFEKKVEIDLSTDDFEVVFKGIIDKIMYKKDNNQTLISIIDYKTGNPSLNLNNIIYGLEMQLCIYAYLCSKMEAFENPKLVGIYLQKILNKEINITPKKDYLTLKSENLKLQGYSIDNEVILKQFDNSYQDSKLIKGLRLCSKGFHANSKIFSQEVLDALLKIVDKKVKEARDKILNREFFINPKKIGIKNLIGCQYCKYKELCFMTDNDIVNLKEYKNLEFLEGEKNEMD